MRNELIKLAQDSGFMEKSAGIAARWPRVTKNIVEPLSSAAEGASGVVKYIFGHSVREVERRQNPAMAAAKDDVLRARIAAGGLLGAGAIAAKGYSNAMKDRIRNRRLIAAVLGTAGVGSGALALSHYRKKK